MENAARTKTLSTVAGTGAISGVRAVAVRATMITADKERSGVLETVVSVNGSGAQVILPIAGHRNVEHLAPTVLCNLADGIERLVGLVEAVETAAQQTRERSSAWKV